MIDSTRHGQKLKFMQIVGISRVRSAHQDGNSGSTETMPKGNRQLRKLGTFPEDDTAGVDTVSTEGPVRIKYVRVDRGPYTAPPLEKMGSCYVLRNTKFAKLPAGKTVVAFTGIQMKIPSGYQGRIFEFNKYAHKNRITVGGGILDSSNTDEIRVVLMNHSTMDRTVKEGNPVALLCIEKLPNVDMVEVPHLKASISSGGNKIANELAELESITS